MWKKTWLRRSLGIAVLVIPALVTIVMTRPKTRVIKDMSAFMVTKRTEPTWEAVMAKALEEPTSDALLENERALVFVESSEAVLRQCGEPKAAKSLSRESMAEALATRCLLDLCEIYSTSSELEDSDKFIALVEFLNGFLDEHACMVGLKEAVRALFQELILEHRLRLMEGHSPNKSEADRFLGVGDLITFSR